MPEEINLSELHSEEIEDIIGRRPRWIVRRGNLVTSLVILIALLGAWFIKYPDTISAPVLISSTTPPLKIFSKTSGKIEILIKNGENVRRGQLIGIIGNPANTRDMFFLKSYVAHLDSLATIDTTGMSFFLKKNIQVGEVQSEYAELFFILSKTFFHPLQVSKESIRIKLYAKKIQGLIAAWEDRYTLRSPVTGTIVSFNNMNNYQYVGALIPLFIVIPKSRGHIVRMSVPTKKSGRLAVGQDVLIFLQDYPYQEFGMLKAQIDDISPVPMDTGYVVDLKLINGLITTKGKEVKSRSEIAGTGQVVMDNKSILNRILEKF